MFKRILIIIMAVTMTSLADSKWIDVSQNKTLKVYGLAWFEENDNKYIRLPLSEQEKITKTAWWMSLCPSTARVRFKTNSTSLRVKIDHGMADESRLAMWHMGSVAVSGIDLYIGEPGKASFWRTTKPQKANGEYEHLYFNGMEKCVREFTLYLPSYSELKSLKIGIDEDAEILPSTPYEHEKPIVIYGTSITQGACASRGSNGFVAQLERRLNTDVINLGFSGSGCGEPVMAELMSQIDASIYIVDSVANMDTTFMDERYENFIKILRKNRPDVPVVLMTKIHFAYETVPAKYAESVEYYNRQHKALFDTYKKLKEQGDDKIFLFDTGKIIQTGGDHPTADGIHLTDVGFTKIANELAPFLSKQL